MNIRYEEITKCDETENKELGTDTVKNALDDIIEQKQIRIVFQPIISLKDGSILGHEALSRITCDSAIRDPEMLFTVAGVNLWSLYCRG